MQSLDINSLASNFIGLIQTNIIPVLILIVFVVYIFYLKISSANNPRTRSVRKYWQAIQKSAVLMSRNFQAVISDMDFPAFSFKGALYKIDSNTYDQIIEREFPTEILQEEYDNILKLEQDLPEDQKTPLQEDKGHFYKFETYKLLEKRKEETALGLIPTSTGGQIIAIRRSGLRETESILSEVEEIPLIELDPELSKGHLKLIMLAMGVYILLMMYFILTQTDPTLMFSATAWPWYVLLFVGWWAKMKIDNEKIGRKILYRGSKIADETFSLRDQTGDDKLVLTVPVYDVTIHYHPAIPCKNLLNGIGKEEIWDTTLQNLSRRVTKLSAEKSSLEASVEQLKEIKSHLDTQLVDAQLKHIESFNDGFISGYARYHISVPESENQPSFTPKQGPNLIEWFRESKIIILIGMLLVAGYFIFQGLNQAISDATISGSLNIFSTNTIIGLIILLVAFMTFIRFTK